MTGCVESALVEHYRAAGGPPVGMALAAVGSLARRELGPRSDIDLVLLHDGRAPSVSALAERLWYPLWDAKLRLDHAVRTPAECADVAQQELSAAVGLLDLRLIDGDAALLVKARQALLDAWRSNARRRLTELLDGVAQRHAAWGDAADLLEPDLKEARGGTRDVTMLRALAATWLVDRPHSGVDGPYGFLLDVRDALHVSAGRGLDRLVAAEIPEIADRLGFADPDALRVEVSMTARRVGHALDLTLRAARQLLPARGARRFSRRSRQPELERAPHGLVVHAGEVGLDHGTDPALLLVGLRAAALAARRGLALSPVTAAKIGAHAQPPPHPWPDAAREALLELLATGPALLPVWEALDLSGAIPAWIPAWAGIRARPQSHPIHRHTVDRHSVQAVTEAQPRLTAVNRPDLLLLACLLHDIGKLPGIGGQHPAVGAPIARRAVETMGFSTSDADAVERLVRHHLSLAELATRRDHEDPATVDALLRVVDGRAEMLALLRQLTEADARAVGSAAWTSWRASLIHALADRCESQLTGRSRPRFPERQIDRGLARAVQLDRVPRVQVESRADGLDLVVAAPDRVGLFSQSAGLLAAHGISVRSAVVHTRGTATVNTWRVDGRTPDELPDPALLVHQLERLERGDTSMLGRVWRREAHARRSPTSAPPHVEAVPGASDSAAVIEVRTSDRPGLLFALGTALTDSGLAVRSAHINTLAGQAIDTFYLTEFDGRRPSAARTVAAVEALNAAVTPVFPAPADPPRTPADESPAERIRAGHRAGQP